VTPEFWVGLYIGLVLGLVFTYWPIVVQRGDRGPS
jgi:Mg/Co/Ni transporter MgtE